MRTWALLVSVLTACDSGEGKPDCDGAAKAVVTVYKAADPAKATLVERCTAARWTAAATSCLRAATTHAAIETCRHDHLTGRQGKAFDDIGGSNDEVMA